MADAVQAQQSAAGAAEEMTADALGEILGRKSRSDEERSLIKQALGDLAQQVLQGAKVVPGNALATIRAIIAGVDEMLGRQVNVILHNPEFQKLEGTWRGLNHLVRNSPAREDLKVRVYNISKNDLAKTLKKFEGAAWDQSPIFKHIYGEEFDMPGGTPYGCIIGDYPFSAAKPDVDILANMAKIAGAAHCPFIAGADPAMMKMDNWQELNNPSSLSRIHAGPEFANWRGFRNSDDAKYVALAMPRVLSRMPYDSVNNPVEEFDFAEDSTGPNPDKYAWMSAAYAMGANINRSYALYGWTAAIRGTENGMVEDLPVHTFPTSDGGVDMKCPTEIAIGDRREKELADLGLMPLSHYKNEAHAVFFGAQSVQKPTEYDNPDATANARLAANLPYQFAVCRFAHYLKCMVRDQIGSFKSREKMERELNAWINKYVETDSTKPQEVLARYPLQKAQVIVEDVEGAPGYYRSTFNLVPHYQLEGLKVTLSLVSKLPAAK